MDSRMKIACTHKDATHPSVKHIREGGVRGAEVAN